jgi:hypothetical protein
MLLHIQSKRYHTLSYKVIPENASDISLQNIFGPSISIHLLFQSVQCHCEHNCTQILQSAAYIRSWDPLRLTDARLSKSITSAIQRQHQYFFILTIWRRFASIHAKIAIVINGLWAGGSWEKAFCSWTFTE